MNVLTLSLANIRHQWLSSLLTLLLLALGVGTMVVLMLLNAQFKERIERDLSGLDLVVGAKGSPLQLILSSVYHVDIPTGNIPLEDAQAVTQHPMVESAIPLALGDAIDGFRIVGTTPDYLAHYEAVLASGESWNASMEAVLGAEVAHRGGYGVGAEIIGFHGLSGRGQAHDDQPYRVVGVLEATGSTIDRLVLTSIESVHDQHATHRQRQPVGTAGAALAGQPDEEITALLIKYRTPLAAVTLPRLINSQSALQAAAPAFEVARLLRLMGIGTNVLRAFAYLLIAVAGLSIFIALYSSLQRRQFDLAVMRTLGASRRQVLWLTLCEGLLLSIAGTLLGIALGHLAALGVTVWLRDSQQVVLTANSWLREESYLLLLAVPVGVIGALVPALRAYRLRLSTVLAKGDAR